MGASFLVTAGRVLTESWSEVLNDPVIQQKVPEAGISISVCFNEPKRSGPQTMLSVP